MDPPGELIGTGRDADVFALADGTVLRRNRAPHDTEPEARVMAWAREQGIPVPAVHRWAESELVMDRVLGPTMLEDLQRRPWRLVRHARTLARLQRQLAVLIAPDWVPVRPGVPTGTALLHLDLHPMNVMLAPDGPVIIDWTNASRGAASFDAGYSFALMTGFETTGLRDRIGQKVLITAFAWFRGRAEVRRDLVAACDRRLADHNTTAGERAVTERLRARAQARIST